ncbi:PKD domain-containing protein [Bacteroidota bacterium]
MLKLLFFIILLFDASNGFSQLSADFNISQNRRCAPVIVTFVNNSTQGSGIQYIWDFDKGAEVNSLDLELNEVFTESGDYLVSLKVIQGTDTVTEQKTVTINEGPVADFSLNSSIGCMPFQAQLSNTSIQGDTTISEFLWDLKTGTVYKTEDLNFVYDKEGKYDVLFKITDNNGCSDYIEKKEIIEVFKNPAVYFSADTQVACAAPLAVSFVNSSYSDIDVDYTWDFGNGTKLNIRDTSVIYNQEGNFDITLVASNSYGCYDSLTKADYITINQTENDFTIIQYEQEYTNDSLTFCNGEIILTSSKKIGNMLWSINSTSINTTYQDIDTIKLNFASEDEVIVTLISGHNSMCPDTFSRYFTIDPVYSNFSSLTGMTNCDFPVEFQITNMARDAVNYTFYFPTDTISDQSPIIYHYNKSDYNIDVTYYHEMPEKDLPVKQVAVSENGCKDSSTHIYKLQLPIALFTVDKVEGCAPLEVNFYDKSESLQTIDDWTYYFGDGALRSGPNQDVSHTYTVPGEYDAVLVINNFSDYNCLDTSYSIKIKVGEKLNPDFDISDNSICYGDTLYFTDRTDTLNLIDFWNYYSENNFNTGIDTSPNPAVIAKPQNTGLYDVSLQVGYNGCISETTIENLIQVNSSQAYFIDSFLCDNPYNYTFLIYPDSSTSWNLFIDDTVYADSFKVSHAFDTTGDYMVRLQTTNSVTGCSMSYNEIIKVRNVNADFIMDEATCFGEVAEFNSKTSNHYIDSCFIEGFLWDFGDATPRRRTYDTLITHIYPDTGIYEVELVVTADNGCVDTMMKEMKVVVPEPQIYADITEGCGPTLSVNFTNNSDDPTIAGWRWIFGDNEVDISGAQTVNHDYSSPSTKIFNAGLDVLDIYGCRNIVYETITLYNVRAYFQAEDNTICRGETVNFIMEDSSVDSFAWNFGNGMTSETSSSSIYNDIGQYDVSLITYKHGCQDSYIRTNYIEVEEVNADYTVNYSSDNCYPITAQFQHTGANSSIIDGYWSYSNMNYSAGYSQSSSFAYTEPGNYTTSLYVRSINGCSAISSTDIYIQGPNAEFSFTPNQICSGGIVQFTLSDTFDIDELIWYFGDGASSTELNPQHKYNNIRGEVVPTLYVENDICYKLLSNDTLYISNVLADYEIINPKSTYCENDRISVMNNSEASIGYIWKLNNESISTDINPRDIILSEDDFNSLSLIAYDENNCYDTLIELLYAYPEPEITLSYNNTGICVGDIETIDMITNNNNLIELMPDRGIISSSNTSIIVSPDFTTKYIAKVTDNNDCSNKDSVIVFVHPIPVITRIPFGDTTIGIGQSIRLQVNTSSMVNYSWSPDESISCLKCNNPKVNPEKDITYYLTMTDQCYEFTEEFNITVIKDYTLVVADAFTPNGDGENDRIYVQGKNIAKLIEFKIYNRWGNMVYNSDEIDDGWDGTYQGRKLKADTYSYFVRAYTTHNHKVFLKGTFMLIE